LRKQSGLAEEKDVQNSLRAFKPKFLDDLIRVGRAFDGGYLVNERAIRVSRYLLSFGVNYDWSFEADFRKRKSDAQILCFDHSVSKDVLQNEIVDALKQILSVRCILEALSLNFRGVKRRFQALKGSLRLYSNFSSFFSSDAVRFFSKGVSNEESQHFFTISEVFQMIPPDQLVENSVFVKMDIEQSEFRVLTDLVKFGKYLTGLVIEFHDLDILWPNFVGLMNHLKANFEITHVHGNNYSELISNSSTPKVLEVTFLKRSLICDNELPREAVVYPIPGMDQPNDRSKEDYPLYF
jgi:hypothetical protein